MCSRKTVGFQVYCLILFLTHLPRRQPRASTGNLTFFWTNLNSLHVYCSHGLQPWLDLAAIIPWPSTATCIVHTFFCHQFIQPRITADWICNPYVIQASRNLNYNGRTVVVQTPYIFELYIFTGFTLWTFSVFGQAYLPIVGKHYYMHISKLITGFSRWTHRVYSAKSVLGSCWQVLSDAYIKTDYRV